LAAIIYQRVGVRRRSRLPVRWQQPAVLAPTGVGQTASRSLRCRNTLRFVYLFLSQLCYAGDCSSSGLTMGSDDGGDPATSEAPRPWPLLQGIRAVAASPPRSHSSSCRTWSPREKQEPRGLWPTWGFLRGLSAAAPVAAGRAAHAGTAGGFHGEVYEGRVVKIVV
jgi:hypothetical protein